MIPQTKKTHFVEFIPKKQSSHLNDPVIVLPSLSMDSKFTPNNKSLKYKMFHGVPKK
jgi:hypothetical protein